MKTELNQVTLLSDLAKIVVEHPNPSLFLSHLAHKTLEPLDCRGAVLGIVAREGFLDIKGSYGYEEAVVDQFSRIPLWTPMPVTDAVRSGEVLIFESSGELIERYPHLAEYNRDEAVTISIPIYYRHAVIGVVGATTLIAPSENFHESDLFDGMSALVALYIKGLINEARSIDPDRSDSIKTLTPRQIQIINLFTEDLTTDQMAHRLRYSSSTVKQDIIKIYSIFGVNNRPAVIQLAKKAGLLENGEE
jgi:DNA-binding CsgD family transcriptional regulator